MTQAAALIPEFDHEIQSTRKLLERVPDDKSDWKPHSKSMSLGALASHIATIPDWGIQTLEKEYLELGPEDYKPFMPANNAELLARFDDDVQKLRGQLQQVDDQSMEKIWSMKWNGQTVVSMPRGAVIRTWVMNHMIHHRAQLGVYLRLLDIPVPGVYGPSADEAG